MFYNVMQSKHDTKTIKFSTEKQDDYNNTFDVDIS